MSEKNNKNQKFTKEQIEEIMNGSKDIRDVFPDISDSESDEIQFILDSVQSAIKKFSEDMNKNVDEKFQDIDKQLKERTKVVDQSLMHTVITERAVLEILLEKNIIDSNYLKKKVDEATKDIEKELKESKENNYTNTYNNNDNNNST